LKLFADAEIAVKPLSIKLSDSNRKYGYLHWNKKQDSEARLLLSGRSEIAVVLGGLFVGEKGVDYEHRRISIGPAKARSIPLNAKVLHLIVDKDERLQVTWN
jgi:hypothetical protein